MFNLTTIDAVTDILKGGFFEEFLCLMECHDDDDDDEITTDVKTDENS